MTTYQEFLGDDFQDSGAVQSYANRQVMKVIVINPRRTWTFRAVFDRGGLMTDAFELPLVDGLQRCLVHGIPVEEE